MGLLFVSRRYKKGLPFRLKMVYMNMCTEYMKGLSQPYKTLLSTPGASYCRLTIFFPYLKLYIFLVIVSYFCLDSMLFLFGSCHMLQNAELLLYSTFKNAKYHLYINTVKPPFRGDQFINHPQLAVSNQSPNSEKNCGKELSVKPLLSACARGLLLAIPAPITSISGQQALDNLSLASF